MGTVFNYKQDDWVKGIQELGKVDLVLDMVCGEYVNKDLQVLKRGGRIALIGTNGGHIAPNLDFRYAMRSWLTISGSTIRARTAKDKATIGQDLLQHVWPLFAEGKLKIIVDSSFTLEEASKAHELMESSKHIGKI